MDISQGYKSVVILSPTIKTATGTFAETGVDIEQYLEDGMVIVQVGVTGDTLTTLYLKVQGSENGTTYPDDLVVFGSIQGGSTWSNKHASAKVPLGKYKKIRVYGSFVSTGTPSFNIGVSLLADAGVNKSDLNSSNFA